jgi:hypothetical protein
MSSDDAVGRQDHLPLDDVPESADPWGDDLADPFADPASANLFSAEIENVNASDWDVDTASIWGDEAGSADIDGGEALGLDLPF